MFIPRYGLRSRPHLYNNGSIKNDFVNFDEEIEELESQQITPGPGQYATADVRSHSQKGHYTNFSKFGTGSERFQKAQSGTDLGPGQYKINHKGYRSALDKL